MMQNKKPPKRKKVDKPTPMSLKEFADMMKRLLRVPTPKKAK